MNDENEKQKAENYHLTTNANDTNEFPKERMITQ